MKLGTVVGFAFGLVLAFAAVALAQAAGVDAGEATGTTALVGGLGSAGAAMSLVAWDKIKGEPARRAEFTQAMDKQEERAVGERREMRAEVVEERKAVREELQMQLSAIAKEQSKMARAWVAMTGNPEVTSVVRRAMRDEDL